MLEPRTNSEWWWTFFQWGAILWMIVYLLSVLHHAGWF